MTQAYLDKIKELSLQGFRLMLDGVLKSAAYNAAPTELLPVIYQRDGTLHAEMMSWGVKPGPDGPFVTNARDDSLLVKRMFKESAQKRRCVILADGFYEWQTIGRAKVPHYFFLKGHEPFTFAGLYEPPATPEGPSRCMVVTTTPNSMLEAFHDRMPVILAPEMRKAWLGDQPLTPENLSLFCRPYPVELMQEHRTDSKMSNARYKAADALDPWKPDPGELLFSAP
jgi:putative SOS response-associated peptidase YedK